MVRVALIGLGHWGPNLARCLAANPAVELRWLVDLDAQRLSGMAARGVSARTASSFEQLPLSELDAVVIATPAATHAALVQAALEAGLHVLVEKPLTTAVAQAEALVALAEARGRTLMVGHVFLFNPAAQVVSAQLPSLGCLRVVSMERTNFGPVRRDVGATFDLLAHDVSLAEFWLGGPPTVVNAVGGSWLRPPLADTVTATLTYPTGLLVQLRASWLSPVKSRQVSVVGSRAMLTWNELDQESPVKRFALDAPDRLGPADVIAVAKAEPLQSEVDHFIACLEHQRSPRSDARFGASVVRTLEALERSSAAGGSPVGR
jgi:predicted dehydrogenase